MKLYACSRKEMLEKILLYICWYDQIRSDADSYTYVIYTVIYRYWVYSIQGDIA